MSEGNGMTFGWAGAVSLAREGGFRASSAAMRPWQGRGEETGVAGLRVGVEHGELAEGVQDNKGPLFCEGGMVQEKRSSGRVAVVARQGPHAQYRGAPGQDVWEHFSSAPREGVFHSRSPCARQSPLAPT
jgi:hypothetical protein